MIQSLALSRKLSEDRKTVKSFFEALTVCGGGVGAKKAGNPNTSQGYLRVSAEELDLLCLDSIKHQDLKGP